MSFYGTKVKTEIFGQSHGERVGVRVYGLPRGEYIDIAALREFCDLRKPKSAIYSTPRKESDNIIFSRGININNGCLDGAVFEAYMRNSDVISQKRTVPRPGHADYPAYARYGEIPSGGGTFSGRMTAPMCIAGGVFIQLLKKRGISFDSHILSLHGVCDEGFDTISDSPSETYKKAFPVINENSAEAMLDEIRLAKEKGDSVGGVIEGKITGLPVGLGGALFDGLEGKMASALFGIPSVKGVSFGLGFSSAYVYGSENNDGFYFDGKIKTATNNCGGILGGMADGMPLIFTVAFKPVPTISVPQASVDLATNENVVFSGSGRNDVCVLPRAVPAVISAAAMAIYDTVISLSSEENNQ